MGNDRVKQAEPWRYGLRNLGLFLQASAFDDARDLQTLLEQARQRLGLIEAEAETQRRANADDVPPTTEQ